jgi:hypothetical protein
LTLDAESNAFAVWKQCFSSLKAMLLPSEINAPALLNDCNRHAGAMLFFLKWRKCRDKKSI